jgi:uncharacterized membrane protein YeaQ/YmgE (transglycosylase-associated protein family)
VHGLVFLPFGLLIGALAKWLASRHGRSRTLPSMFAGGLGAVVGGECGRGLAVFRDEGPRGFAMSLLGAFVLVVAYHALTILRGLKPAGPRAW